MNTLIKYVIKDNANVLERDTFACRNLSHCSIKSNDVRHRTLSQTLSLTISELPSRTLDSIKFGMEFTFGLRVIT